MTINALLLNGWDHTSTWGTEYGEFYAQLTPNGVSDTDGPQIWVTRPQYVVHDAPGLARAIATATGASLGEVIDALLTGDGVDDRDFGRA